MNAAIKTGLEHWLAARMTPEGLTWLGQQTESIAAGQLRALYLGFGLVARKVPREPLRLTEAELDWARKTRPGWSPQHWSVADAARTLLLVSAGQLDEATFLDALDRLFAAGEMQELIALYQALPVLPYPAAHRARAGEGIRTNMGAVFKAVAHHNPYPSEFLDEGMWNQLVLKCLFVEVLLEPVVGLDRRKNAALSRMLRDYAHERWAASRPISPELWRCVDPDLDPAAITDLARVIEQGNATEQQAAALSLAGSQHPDAQQLLSQQSRLATGVLNREFTWESIAAQLRL